MKRIDTVTIELTQEDRNNMIRGYLISEYDIETPENINAMIGTFEGMKIWWDK